MNVRQATGINPDLDQTRANPSLIDSIKPLRDPASAQFHNGIGKGMTRQELIATRAIVASVRQDLQVSRARQSPQQNDVATNPFGRALHQCIAAQVLYLLNFGKNLIEDYILIVAIAGNVIGAN